MDQDISAVFQQALATLGRLSPEQRLIQLVAAPGGDPPPILSTLVQAAVLERFSGREAVCEGFRFELDLLSPSAELDLAPLLAQPLGVALQQADGNARHWFGLVTGTGLLGSDGGLARYRLVIEPFTALLKLRRNALIFPELDVQGVVTRVLADYPLAAFRWEVTQPLVVRPITTQYRETDYQFLVRLLAEAGLSWHFEHGGQSPAAHTWVIRDREAAIADQGTIRFHRTDASEADDAIAAFSPRLQVVPSARGVASWQAEQVATVAANAQADPAGLPPREVFTLPRAGRFATPDQAQQAADLQLDALRLAQQVQTGVGSARSLRPAAAFTLTQHSSHEGQAFVPLVVEHQARNNLGAGMAELLALAGLSALDQGSYRNRFAAVALGTPIVPRDQPRPLSTGPQTAQVVGLPDQAVSPNREHQVRVQFPWQRGLQPHAGGLDTTGSTAHPDGHAPGDHTSGTWVPVAEWLAGPNWGSHFLPRLGAEVLVEFLHGDLDQPRITGQLFNGQVAPPFALDGNHPGTLSGLHSQAHDRSGTQQWLLDDATGQLRTRLHTSLADSRLELGYLVQHSDGQRGALRGQGFELATQGWGNVHAPRGLLLSATARANAASTQLDVAEALAQYQGAERTAQALHEALQQQQVPGLQANPQQVALRQAMDPQEQGRYTGAVNGQAATKPAPGSREGQDPVERFAQPLLLAEGPDRLAWTTPASALAYAGNQLHLTSQEDTHLAAGQTWAAVSGRHGALFAQTGPVRAIAAHGPVSLQAHTGPLELLADQSVTFTATDDRIEVLAKDKIVLQAGQTQITLQGGDITFACPGKFTVKASQHPFMAGESGAAQLTPLPEGLTKPDGNAPFSV